MTRPITPIIIIIWKRKCRYVRLCSRVYAPLNFVTKTSFSIFPLVVQIVTRLVAEHLRNRNVFIFERNKISKLPALSSNSDNFWSLSSTFSTFVFIISTTSSTCAWVCCNLFCAATCWGVLGPPTIPSSPPEGPRESPVDLNYKIKLRIFYYAKEFLIKCDPFTIIDISLDGKAW